MIPSVWGQVCDRIFSMAHAPHLTDFLGRQARGPLRSPTAGRLLHRHVTHLRRNIRHDLPFSFVSPT